MKIHVWSGHGFDAGSGFWHVISNLGNLVWCHIICEAQRGILESEWYIWKKICKFMISNEFVEHRHNWFSHIPPPPKFANLSNVLILVVTLLYTRVYQKRYACGWETRTCSIEHTIQSFVIEIPACIYNCSSCLYYSKLEIKDMHPDYSVSVKRRRITKTYTSK